MLKPLWKDRDVHIYLEKYNKQLNNSIVDHFKKIGSAFVTIARTSHPYKNQTGNLESSIAFVVLNRGVTVYEDFKLAKSGTEKVRGITEAHSFINRQRADFLHGISLIVVAGMHYAVYVEARGLDVITGSSLIAKKMLRQAIREIKKEATQK